MEEELANLSMTETHILLKYNFESENNVEDDNGDEEENLDLGLWRSLSVFLNWFFIIIYIINVL